MTPPKAKSRRTRPPDETVLARVARAKRPDVALSFERMSIAASTAIAKKLRSGEPISIEMLGVMRICAEWHTDFLSVQASGGTLDPDPHEPVVPPSPTGGGAPKP